MMVTMVGPLTHQTMQMEVTTGTTIAMMMTGHARRPVTTPRQVRHGPNSGFWVGHGTHTFLTSVTTA